MAQIAHHYLIFETAAGFCGIAWHDAGITRFQLPANGANSTERSLLRRLSGAKPASPTPQITAAIAAVRRYFEGERTDFSELTLDLHDQEPLFQQIYAAARQIGWGQTSTYG